MGLTRQAFKIAKPLQALYSESAMMRLGVTHQVSEVACVNVNHELSSIVQKHIYQADKFTTSTVYTLGFPYLFSL